MAINDPIIGHDESGNPIWQKPGGQRYVLKPTGAELFDSPGDVIPRGTWEAFGARIKVMNLAANPEAARHYFETIGYETRPYGEGWNFAYRRRNTDEPWQPLDPKGPDLGDVTDIISDAIIGFGSGAVAVLAGTAAGLGAAPSGPGAVAAGIGAGALAGGGTAAGLEALKQGIGAGAGIEQNFDPAAIAVTGAGAALAEPLGAAGGFVARGIARGTAKLLQGTGRLAPEMAAKFIGIKSLGTTTSGRVMMEGVKLTREGHIPLVTPERAGLILRGALKFIKRIGIPEVRAADTAIDAAATGGLVARLGRAMRDIENQALTEAAGTKTVTKETTARTVSRVETESARRAGVERGIERKGLDIDLETGNVTPSRRASISETRSKVTGQTESTTERRVTATRETEVPVFAPARTREERIARGASPTIPNEARELLDAIRRETGYAGPWDETPVDVAYEIKQILQKRARGEGAFKGAGPSEIYGKMVTRASGRVRKAINQSMDAVNPGFRDLMREAERKAQQFDQWSEALMLSDRGAKGRQAAANLVRGIYGSHGTAYNEALIQLGIQFSSGQRGLLIDRAIKAVRAANVGRAIGARGLGETLPLFTATGKFRGVAALPVIGGAAMLGGPVAGLAGTVAASPRVMMRIAGPTSRAFGSLEAFAQRAANRQIGSLTRMVGQGVLNTAQIKALRTVIENEGGGSKHIARQDTREAPPKRRLVFIGQ